MSSPEVQTQPDVTRSMDVLVRDKRRLASRIVAIDMEPATPPLPGWTPGAHIDISTPAGWRPYSLCGSVGEPTWRIAVLREEASRGGSAWVHDQLEPGMRLSVRGTRNLFPLVDSTRYLFIAGGIGITPLLPMVAMVAARHADWRMIYGGRSRDSMAFLDELGRYGDRVQLWPLDTHGPLPLDSLLASPATEHPTTVYCCGPEGLISAVEQRCADNQQITLRTERFTPLPREQQQNDTSFDVMLSRTGRRLTVGPGDTILDALEKAGVDAPWSCRSGFCGTCELGVRSGTPDHRDEVLTDQERAANDRMMICVSRSMDAELTLDL